MSGIPSDGPRAGGPTQAPAGTRILLVEDFEPLRALMVRVLTIEGYQVVSVGTVWDAVALCTSERFDLLITDYRVSGGNGGEIAKRAVAHNPDIGILFVSGSRESALNLEVPGAAPVRFLQKPVDIDELTRCVRALVGGPAEPG